MEFLNLDEIKGKVNDISLLIEAPEELLPTYGISRDFAYPHIEIDEIGYHFVIVERGEELNRKTSKDIDDLMYWVFESVTFSMASDYELKHRVENQDSRKLLFKTQLDMIGKISEKFAERLQAEFDQILKVAPYTVPPKFD